MAIKRVVEPEQLDHLAPDDPQACRSRRDLRRINAAMGNFRWVERTLRRLDVASVVEIGAGDGGLAGRLAGRWTVTAIDRAPRPPSCRGVTWREGDLFDVLPGVEADAVIGVMIVHHFSDDELAGLGRMLARFRCVCLCEPWRSGWPLRLGQFLSPAFGPVTRHDMAVSIRAGFRMGELVERLALTQRKIVESVDWRGSIRLLAVQP